ncbi:MAG: endonuclease [Crocinitomicaceae bacterium]
MKHFLTLLLFTLCLHSTAQVPAYYDGVDLGLTGLSLRDELGDHVTATHTSPSTYSEVWDILKVGDLDPENASNVLLIYGYNDADGSLINDRTRDKDANGGSVGEWNREHVFPKSLGEPDLGTSGPGSDPHNVHASDVQMNGDRSNRMFADATGNAGTVGSYWYPGDEWKGDAARIIMYMYIRYETRCKPNSVAVGSTNALDPQMVNILLEWNVEDPVSEHEDDRNEAIYNAIGNRNPFIDNPYFATLIWGGEAAENRWGNLSLLVDEPFSFIIYPQPAINRVLYIEGNVSYVTQLEIYSLSGQLSQTLTPVSDQEIIEIDLTPTSNSRYILLIHTKMGIITRKIWLQ